jgi:hypothetical protein
VQRVQNNWFAHVAPMSVAISDWGQEKICLTYCPNYCKMGSDSLIIIVNLGSSVKSAKTDVLLKAKYRIFTLAVDARNFMGIQFLNPIESLCKLRQ